MLVSGDKGQIHSFKQRLVLDVVTWAGQGRSVLGRFYRPRPGQAGPVYDPQAGRPEISQADAHLFQMYSYSLLESSREIV